MVQPDNLPTVCRVHRNGRPLISMTERCCALEAPGSLKQGFRYFSPAGVADFVGEDGAVAAADLM
jgi:hypothetical protein